MHELRDPVEIAVITWIDAGQDADGSIQLALCDLPITLAISCGVLIGESKNHITIARDWFQVEGELKTVRWRLNIPRGMIRSMMKFTLNPKE